MLIKNALTDVVKENYLEESKPSVRKKEIEYNKPLDLCSTCNNSQTCIYHKENRELVIFCEEFDDYVPEQKNYEIKGQVSGSKQREAKIYLGLCRNCDFRETCTHVKPEGGIWHCEDYQ